MHIEQGLKFASSRLGLVVQFKDFVGIEAVDLFTDSAESGFVAVPQARCLRILCLHFFVQDCQVVILLNQRSSGAAFGRFRRLLQRSFQ
ncbi:hypothetical protein D3C77_681050 [compost metagenome]